MEPRRLEQLRPQGNQSPAADRVRPGNPGGGPDEARGASPESPEESSGRAYAPESATLPPNPPSRAGKRALGALALAAALGIGWLGLGGPGTRGSDSLLAAETSAPAYQKHKMAQSGGSIQLSQADLDPAATSAAVEAARAGRPIPGLSASSPELTNAIARGEVQFYTVRAMDTCAEDGDYVTLSTSNGARMGSFMITHAGSTLSIPVVGGQVPDVQLIADKDGVGGITVGVQTSGGTWYSGVLAEGQMQAIPVAAR